MAKQAWLQQIRSSTNPTEQIAALRAIKNEIIGHPFKKEMVASLGILDSIARISCNRTDSKDSGKVHDHKLASRSLTEEESVRLQALYIIASVALGGPPFIPILHSASVIPAILSNICPLNNPPRVVLAALRALSDFADSLALASTSLPLSTSTLADAVFVRQHLLSLCRILSQSSSFSTIQSQISTAASLIGKLCREERHQQSLANSGVLDALATRLAAFVVAEGLVIPGADILAQKDGLQDFFPTAAPKNADLAPILEAIAAIIEDSKLRASQLLYSPSILAIFPSSLPDELAPLQGNRSTWNFHNNAGLNTRHSQLNAVDLLLPLIPLPQLKNTNTQAAAFPPLGSSGARDNLSHSGRSGMNISDTIAMSAWSGTSSLETSISTYASPLLDSEDAESPLVSYLIYIIRSRAGIERLMATSVLTILYRVGLTHKSRDTAITLLVVPLLVQILDDDPAAQPMIKDSSDSMEATATEWTIKERAPAILAMLITDSEYLQKAAFDANVISKLSKMLKVSYDPVPDSANSQSWSPQGDDEAEAIGFKRSSRFSSPGQPPLLLHKIRVRESTLKAIAALVPFQDEYRKVVVEQGIIPYIVESMCSNPRKPTPKLGDRPEKEVNGSKDQGGPTGYGVNPVSVIIAACGAVRALSRSVSILRTSLIDNGVAMPVFRLLQHPDIEVQIAATATVCNLVTDVSPMREIITEAGVLKILCEHAHSMNAKLRLNALWALKHFVHAVGNDMKRLCLEELGQGWLVQLISDDTEVTSDKATGETAVDNMDVDVDMDRVEDHARPPVADSFSHPGLSRPSGSLSKSMQQAESRLAALRDAELNPARKARKDDIAVQEQGLDFIRNLIGGAGQGGTSGPAEMIDFLFNTLGQDRVFQILTNKLRPRPVNPFSRRGTATIGETRIIPPQSEIITAVGYILVHMAASEPRHRQLIIAQTELLKLLVPQFNHPSIEVRLALCWLVTNLTWMDDASDGQACATRAHELRKLGFFTKLEILEQEDPELNVRERAKSALWQMKKGY